MGEKRKDGEGEKRGGFSEGVSEYRGPAGVASRPEQKKEKISIWGGRILKKGGAVISFVGGRFFKGELMKNLKNRNMYRMLKGKS